MASRKHESSKGDALDGSPAGTFTSDFTVRFGEVDRAQVLYYPRFFHLFHQTFEEWFGGALGVPYPEVVDNENLGFPTVKVETEFLKPLRYGDRVRIVLELVAIGKDFDASSQVGSVGAQCFQGVALLVPADDVFFDAGQHEKNAVRLARHTCLLVGSESAAKGVVSPTKTVRL